MSLLQCFVDDRMVGF